MFNNSHFLLYIESRRDYSLRFLFYFPSPLRVQRILCIHLNTAFTTHQNPDQIQNGWSKNNRGNTDGYHREEILKITLPTTPEPVQTPTSVEEKEVAAEAPLRSTEATARSPTRSSTPSKSDDRHSQSDRKCIFSFIFLQVASRSSRSRDRSRDRSQHRSQHRSRDRSHSSRKYRSSHRSRDRSRSHHHSRSHRH